MPKATDSSRINSSDPMAVDRLRTSTVSDIRKVERDAREASKKAGQPIVAMSEAIPEPTTEPKFTFVDQGGTIAMYFTTNGRRFKMTLTEE